MERQTQSNDIPKWSALLVEAVNKPGMIMKAYSASWNYSIGNQLLALVQCHLRGIQPGPINTFPKWQTLGRVVKRGERALTLCMPITRKRRDEDSDDEHTFTSFVHRARWFVVSQTIGNELGPVTIPEWDAEQALAALSIERIPFDKTDGNVQGFARDRQVAINPVAQLPHKTLFHEMAHLCSAVHKATRSYTRPKAVSPTQNRRQETFAKWKRKRSRCCVVKHLAWKERTTRAATYRIGARRNRLQGRGNPRKKRSEDFPRRTTEQGASSGIRELKLAKKKKGQASASR